MIFNRKGKEMQTIEEKILYEDLSDLSLHLTTRFLSGTLPQSTIVAYFDLAIRHQSLHTLLFLRGIFSTSFYDCEEFYKVVESGNIPYLQFLVKTEGKPPSSKKVHHILLHLRKRIEYDTFLFLIQYVKRIEIKISLLYTFSSLPSSMTFVPYLLGKILPYFFSTSIKRILTICIQRAIRTFQPILLKYLLHFVREKKYKIKFLSNQTLLNYSLSNGNVETLQVLQNNYSFDFIFFPLTLYYYLADLHSQGKDDLFLFLYIQMYKRKNSPISLYQILEKINKDVPHLYSSSHTQLTMVQKLLQSNQPITEYFQKRDYSLYLYYFLLQYQDEKIQTKYEYLQKFFSISSRLPPELQQRICNLSFESNKEFIWEKDLSRIIKEEVKRNL